MSTQKQAPPIFEPVEVTVRKVEEETPGTKSLYLDYDRKAFQYEASQAVRLFVDTQDGHRIPHAFSIASSPTEDFLLFTTRIRPESSFKRSIERLKPGDKLNLVGPFGRFVLPPDTGRDHLPKGMGNPTIEEPQPHGNTCDNSSRALKGKVDWPHRQDR